jgi:hypothetical protein
MKPASYEAGLSFELGFRLEDELRSKLQDTR